MDKDMARLCAKIDKVQEDVDDIRDNHLCSIWKELGRLAGAQTVIKALSIATFISVIGWIVYQVVL